MMKTAISVLQEMMIKSGEVPEYECISQSGPHHQAVFEYRCKCRGVSVTARARSKKDAKQEAARRALAELFARGHPVPPPYARPPSPRSPSPDPASPASPSTRALPSAGVGGGPTASVDCRSYVALLKELCEQYGLGAAEYEVVGDAGPPHQRHFTVRVRLARHERLATSTTKKAAKQLAAERLYKYLRENLARLTADFVEEEALARAHERAMERYVEERAGWRRPLGQRVADYHLGVLMHLEEAQLQSGQLADADLDDKDPVSALQRLCGALGLGVQCGESGGVWVTRVSPSAPPLAAAGASPAAAHAAALRHLRRSLQRARLAPLPPRAP